MPSKRTAAEIRQLFTSFAEKDARVRAVVLTGSRADASIPPDEFQDFDLCFFVRSFNSFVDDRNWIDQFGNRIILQCPRDMELPAYKPEPANRFSYLMLFSDHNRVDITLIPADDLSAARLTDGPFEIWMDKDQMLTAIPKHASETYQLSLPGEKIFQDVCNEFWWVTGNVCKGLARGDLVYAKRHVETILRVMMMHMIDWKIAATHGPIRKQKRDVWLKTRLPDADFNALTRTYAGAEISANWCALLEMTTLFAKLSADLAAAARFNLNTSEASAVQTYLAAIYRSYGGADQNRFT